MSFTSSETIESFSSHCGTGQARRGAGLGKRTEQGGEEGEAVCHTTGCRSSTAGWLFQGGSVKGGWLVFVCVGGGGGQEELRRGRESYPGTPEQFVTLEWLLSYPGGPLIAGEFSGRRVGKREGL